MGYTLGLWKCKYFCQWKWWVHLAWWEQWKRRWEKLRLEGRKESEPSCFSTTCFFNPNSALKYGHHVDPLKSCSSAAALANQMRWECPGGGMWGGSRSQSRRGRFKRVCAVEESHCRGANLMENWNRPMETGWTVNLDLFHFLVLSSCPFNCGCFLCVCVSLVDTPSQM